MHKLRGTIYRHKKSGNDYEFLGLALLESTTETMAIYRAIEDGLTWVRPCKEFFDGRFEFISVDNKSQLETIP